MNANRNRSRSSTLVACLCGIAVLSSCDRKDKDGPIGEIRQVPISTCVCKQGTSTIGQGDPARFELHLVRHESEKEQERVDLTYGNKDIFHAAVPNSEMTDRVEDSETPYQELQVNYTGADKDDVFIAPPATIRIPTTASFVEFLLHARSDARTDKDIIVHVKGTGAGKEHKIKIRATDWEVPSGG